MRYWLLTHLARWCGFELVATAKRTDPGAVPFVVLFTSTDVTETRAAIMRLTEQFTKIGWLDDNTAQPAPQEGTA